VNRRIICASGIVAAFAVGLPAGWLIGLVQEFLTALTARLREFKIVSTCPVPYDYSFTAADLIQFLRRRPAFVACWHRPCTASKPVAWV
jgi:hypothetical protein